MEIKEVLISQEHNKKKKFSPKIREETKRYLSKRGIGEDDLSRKQWEYIAQYVKTKLYAKPAVLIMLLPMTISIIVAFYSYKSVKSTAEHLANYIPAETIIVHDNGTSEILEANQEIIENYAKINILVGFGMCLFIFLCYFAISFVVKVFWDIRKRGEFFEAFLPTVKRQISHAI